MAFNSAAHNKPSLIRDLLDTLLPNLYRETKIRVSLLKRISVSFIATCSRGRVVKAID